MLKNITTVELVMKRQTKGSLLYENPKGFAGQTVGNIYLRKDAFPQGDYPATVVVTVSRSDRD